MKWIAPLLLALVSGCAAAPIRDYAVRLETDRSVCSATKAGERIIETAAHCVAFPLKSIDGHPVSIVRSWVIGPDRIQVLLSGITFAAWAPRGVAKVGERVRWWGQPLGVPYVYREGRVAWISADGKLVAVDATICHGDSGSGLFNDDGELVGVISAMTNEAGCTFVVAH